MDTGNAGMKDIPTLDEYVLLGKKDKKITNNCITVHTDTHKMPLEHRGRRLPQTKEIREDFLKQVLFGLRPSR